MNKPNYDAQTSFVEIVKGKKVLFVTTKNIDYLRNTQEIRMLETSAESVGKIYSTQKKYVFRILDVWKKLFFYEMSAVEVVFVGFSPQLLLPFYGRFSSKTIIVDFFISVYDTFVKDRKKFKEKSLLADFSHWLDAYIIKKADHIITDTIEHQKYFRKEFNGASKSFENLYLEADETIYYPRKENKPEYLQDKYVVLYFGSILPLQGIDVVLETVAKLKDEKDIYLQIIGPISSEYKKPEQDNVEYIDWLEQDKLAEYIGNSDLCLAGHFCADIEKAKRTIPGKAYIYKSMEKPMILGDNPANRELFEESNDIKFVEMGNVDALKDAIIEMYQERKEHYEK